MNALLREITKGERTVPKYYLVVSSVTTAQRLQKLCREAGISVSVVHTPQGLTDRGCSYSVVVKESDFPRAQSLASENQLPVRQQFLYQDGEYIECP